jgi:hypothetical protein
MPAIELESRRDTERLGLFFLIQLREISLIHNHAYRLLMENKSCPIGINTSKLMFILSVLYLISSLKYNKTLIPTFMAQNRGVAYIKPGVVEVQNIDYPKLSIGSRKCDHGVILKVISTNICGSDQHMVRGLQSPLL